MSTEVADKPIRLKSETKKLLSDIKEEQKLTFDELIGMLIEKYNKFKELENTIEELENTIEDVKNTVEMGELTYTSHR